MAANSINILLIEDNPAYARLLQEFIKQANSHEINLIHVTYLAEAIKKLNQDNYNIILLDLTLPDSEGLASLSPLINQAPTIPIVVLTNTNDDELALEAVRRGAQDYLVKREVNSSVLMRSLRYAIERKQVLEQLRAANQGLENQVEESAAELVKAQEINQSKSEFVSMLSHDIRNPLNTIMLAAGLLQSNDEKLPKEKKISHFQLIRSAIKNMAQLLDEVSFIGKADSGKVQCDFTCFNIEEFCHAIVAEAQFTAAEKQVHIVFYHQGELVKALWDESLLRHILSNLLNNAIKYSHPGGIVLFELITEGTTVIFRIQDRGIGIPQKYQQQLFQAFHRAENVGQIPGTGLGLAIVKKCVEAHGGEIYIDSEVGVGTTVTVSLSALIPEDF